MEYAGFDDDDLGAAYKVVARRKEDFNSVVAKLPISDAGKAKLKANLMKVQAGFLDSKQWKWTMRARRTFDLIAQALAEENLLTADTVETVVLGATLDVIILGGWRDDLPTEPSINKTSGYPLRLGSFWFIETDSFTEPLDGRILQWKAEAQQAIKQARKLTGAMVNGDSETNQNPYATTLGRKLADARKNKGLTQEQAACALEISVATLQSHEQERRKPNRKKLADYARLYNTNFDSIQAQGEHVRVVRTSRTLRIKRI